MDYRGYFKKPHESDTVSYHFDYGSNLRRIAENLQYARESVFFSECHKNEQDIDNKLMGLYLHFKEMEWMNNRTFTVDEKKFAIVMDVLMHVAEHLWETSMKLEKYEQEYG